MRVGEVQRKTLETKIAARIDLDGDGTAEVSTGVGFLDHMIAQLARHGAFDITLDAKGDLEIDAHHTVEDTGIVLGQAIDRALGERIGIRRMGDATVPMDEALAQVAIDLSGRGYSVFDGSFATDTIGDLGTELIPHFFEALASHARANIFVRILAGRSDHHRAEATFKALARSLNIAVSLDPQRTGQVPSTKGTLSHNTED